jgi:hypothetical protein
MKETMQDIHKIVKVTNNQVIIDLPPEFKADEAEIILKPRGNKEDGMEFPLKKLLIR